MIVYNFFRFWVRLFTIKYKVEGTENLPEEPAIIIGNHAQMNGPIGCMLYYPRSKRIWCIGEMMHMKEVPAYAFQDFWSEKPKYIRWFFKLSSYAIAPLAVCIFNCADTIGVYKDKRVVQTFRQSSQAMQNGCDVIIFPEDHKERNNIIYEFQEGFTELARLYYRESGKEPAFVPMYVAPYLKTIYLGKPIVYDHTANSKEERKRICEYLMNEITEMARALPEHIVKPYENIPKKLYPKNTDYEK